jgi:hypothetical protein
MDVCLPECRVDPAVPRFLGGKDNHTMIRIRSGAKIDVHDEALKAKVYAAFLRVNRDLESVDFDRLWPYLCSELARRAQQPAVRPVRLEPVVDLRPKPREIGPDLRELDQREQKQIYRTLSLIFE